MSDMIFRAGRLFSLLSLSGSESKCFKSVTLRVLKGGMLLTVSPMFHFSQSCLSPHVGNLQSCGTL